MLTCTLTLATLLMGQWAEAFVEKFSGNQQELVEHLRDSGYISTEKVAEIMSKVDRGLYVKYYPYVDKPVTIGYGATISAPHMHAFALEVLQDYLQAGNRALDVGSGSGYLTVCMALMVGKNGYAVGIEHMAELVEYAKGNMLKHDSSILGNINVKFIEGDGRLGYPEGGPYDAIHVGAAAAEVPQALLNQLKNGGRMLIPIGPEDEVQEMTVFDKDNTGRVTKTVSTRVMYVPLTDKEKQ